MSSLKVKRWFALHNEGTKYYQIFLIESKDSPVAALIAHWGAYTEGSTHLPIHTGQTKVHIVKKAEGNWESQRIASSKARRGYQFEPPTSDEFYSPSSFQDHLENTFKRTTALEIFHTVAMGDPIVSKEDADIDHLFGIESKPEAPTPPSEPARGEKWGSW